MAALDWKLLWERIKARFCQGSRQAIESTPSPKPSPSPILIIPTADYVSVFKPFVGPLGDLAKNPISGRSAMELAFGKHVPRAVPGTVGLVGDPAWERRYMDVAKDLPLGISKLYTHKNAEAYIREGLRRAELVSSHRPAKVGCFNVRYQRSNGTVLSDHAYGIAIDVSDRDGVFRRVSKDIDAPFVNAMKSVGFAWGGDYRNFRDDMHFTLRW